MVLESSEYKTFIKLISDEPIILEQILSDKEKKVIKKRFGLIGNKPQSLQKIAESMKLSKERVRQIEIKALYKIRSYISGLNFISIVCPECGKIIRRRIINLQTE